MSHVFQKVNTLFSQIMITYFQHWVLNPTYPLTMNTSHSVQFLPWVVPLQAQMVGTLGDKILPLRRRGMECPKEPVVSLGSLTGRADSPLIRETVKTLCTPPVGKKWIPTHCTLLTGKCSWLPSPTHSTIGFVNLFCLNADNNHTHASCLLLCLILEPTVQCLFNFSIPN